MAPFEGRDPESAKLDGLTGVDRFELGRIDAVSAFQMAADLRWRHDNGSGLLGHHRRIQVVFVMPVGEADNVGSREILQVRPLSPALRPEKRVEKQNPLTGFDAETRPAKIHEPWFVGHVRHLLFMRPDTVGRVVSFDGFDFKDELGDPQNDLRKIHLQQDELITHGRSLQQAARNLRP